MKVYFITGNQNKADFMAKYLNFPINHKKIELQELQSLRLAEIAEHKVKQAYSVVKEPVLIEDMGLYFNALGQLPGVFVKWFLKEIGTEGLCKLLDSYEDRSAVARICYAFYDGSRLKFFDGQVEGTISDKPRGEGSFGWNPIFIPKNSSKTYGEMNEAETERFSLRTTTVFPEIKEFLHTNYH